MLLCDTGVLLATGNVKDHHHAACLALIRAAEGPLLVPSPVLGEIGYLLQSRVGPHAEVTFLKSFVPTASTLLKSRKATCRASRNSSSST
jgi:predicted nucleic acid-binding protein